MTDEAGNVLEIISGMQYQLLNIMPIEGLEKMLVDVIRIYALRTEQSNDEVLEKLGILLRWDGIE